LVIGWLILKPAFFFYIIFLMPGLKYNVQIFFR